MNIPIETGTGYLEAGLGCLPAARSQKRPAVGSWRRWTERLPTRNEVECWFANAHDAICIVAGAVSGNLECLDFDNHGELFESWRSRVDPKLYSGLVVERTPSGGYHVLYRSEEPVEGNLKLARGVREGKVLTLIETRGEGGIFLCAPTEGYVLLQGSFEHIPVLPAAAREALVSAARALDEAGGEVARPDPQAARVGADAAFVSRPGDEFADRGDPRPFLLSAGWQPCGRNPDGNELWTRPGKDPRAGASATLKDGVFYVFSSNAAPFESGRGYNAFQVYALLEHRGDFTAAARTLLALGYGKRDDPLAHVDLSRFDPLAMTVAEAHPAPVKRDFLPIDVLAREYPKMRPVIIDGFLRQGETMNIIAPPKTGKSWLVMDLALSVATGTDFFGYACTQGKVLVIDNELHRETTASRLPRVISARGHDIAKVGPNLCVENQRGRLKTIEDIAANVEAYREEGFKLIIVDAFYRALPRGTDENDNGAIAGLYNQLDRYADAIGCAFVLIHHTSKGNQALKSVTDVGSGAGSQSRAADTHVILRRHRKEGVIVIESVVRSFKSVPPMCLRWDFPLWNRDDTLDPGDLEGKAEVSPVKRGTEAALETEAVLAHIRELVDPENPETKTVFTTKIEKRANVSRAKARMILESALDLKYLACAKLEGGKNAGRYIVLGPVDPSPPQPQEETDGDDDGEDW